METRRLEGPKDDMNGDCPYDYATCEIDSSFGSDYQVLDTDYDNYAIVWSCADMWISHIPMGWLMTRERHSENMNRWKQKAAEVFREKVPDYDWEEYIYDAIQDESCKYHDEIEDHIEDLEG